MKKYKYITILEQKDQYEDRPVYSILNNKSGDELAILYYYKPWKQYVFESWNTRIFNAGCLKDIIDFIDNEIK